MKELRVYLDESGNFDFTKNGTKYYIICAMSTFETPPTKWETELYNLRQNIIAENPNFKWFHASEDTQVTRNKTFSVITKYLEKFRIDSVIVEKCKTYPSLRTPEAFYPKMLGYLIRYILNNYRARSSHKITVILDRLPVKQKKNIIIKTIKTVFADDVAWNGELIVKECPSKDNFSLQLVDYITWAKRRKWEMGDLRSYQLVQSSIKTEFEIFKNGWV